MPKLVSYSMLTCFWRQRTGSDLEHSARLDIEILSKLLCGTRGIAQQRRTIQPYQLKETSRRIPLLYLSLTCKSSPPLLSKIQSRVYLTNLLCYSIKFSAFFILFPLLCISRLIVARAIQDNAFKAGYANI
jgi:hypothetical protein